MAEKKIALFIDADNISPKFGKKILEALESRGELFIRRIYGNWEKSSLHGWNDCILNCSLRAVQQPDFVTGKNATDMSLTIDAMDVLHDGKAEIFALVSNDSDFTPLVIRLREGNMTIIGLGNAAHASTAFRSACTEFIDLETLDKSKKTMTTIPTLNAPAPVSKVTLAPVKKLLPVPDKKIDFAPVKKVEPAKKVASKKFSPVQLSLFDEENPVKPEPKPKPASSKVVPITESETFAKQDKLQPIHDALHEAVKLHAESDGFIQLGCAGSFIKEKNLKFGIKDFGYGTLRQFIIDFPDLYELTNRGETIFYYRCRAKKSPVNVDDDRLQQLHDILREAMTEAVADVEGFVPLSWTGIFIKKKKLGFGIKDFGYGTLHKFIAAFPDRYELINRGEGIFYYRCLACEQEDPVEEQVQQLHDVLIETASVYCDANGFTSINCAGQEIRTKNFGFGVKDFGYSTLRQFIADFPEMYEISYHDSENVFYYRCRTDEPTEVATVELTTSADEQKNFPAEDFKQLHDVLNEVSYLHADAEGLVNLWWVCDFITGKKNLNNDLKTLSHQKLLEIIATFPDRYEVIYPHSGDVCYRCLTGA